MPVSNHDMKEFNKNRNDKKKTSRHANIESWRHVSNVKKIEMIKWKLTNVHASIEPWHVSNVIKIEMMIKQLTFMSVPNHDDM